MRRSPAASGAVVTGAGGFIGRALVRRLLEAGDEVWAVVRPGTMDRLPLHPRLHPVEGLQALPEAVDGTPAVCYHLAWRGTAGAAREDALLQAENIRMTLEAIERTARLGCNRFLLSGSLLEEEVRRRWAVRGDLQPGDSYAFAREAAFHLGRCAAGRLGMEMIGCRITHAYGPGECSERLISRTLRQIRRGERVALTEGRQLYDFLYITDAAAALAALGRRGQAGRVYTVGSGQPRPLRDWMETLLRITGGRGDFGAYPYTGFPLEEADFSTGMLEADTGFHTQVPFAEGIRRTWAWMEGAADGFSL